MDTLSHGLWATALAKTVNIRAPHALRPGRMALWGIVPDLFSFTPVVVWMIWQMSYNGVAFSNIPRPELMTADERNAFFILRLSQNLYHISHSIVIFAGLFGLVWLFRRYRFRDASAYHAAGGGYGRPPGSAPCFEMAGWLVHILMDIPTHSEMLYPTVFLWPLSDFYFNGRSWGNLPFMIGNYLCLLTVFIALRIAGRRTARKMVIRA